MSESRGLRGFGPFRVLTSESGVEVNTYIMPVAFDEVVDIAQLMQKWTGVEAGETEFVLPAGHEVLNGAYRFDKNDVRIHDRDFGLLKDSVRICVCDLDPVRTNEDDSLVFDLEGGKEGTLVTFQLGDGLVMFPRSSNDWACVVGNMPESVCVDIAMQWTALVPIDARIKEHQVSIF